MIVYDLECRDGQHRFEGWFKSSDDFTRQQERGFVSCPQCGTVSVSKAVQAPRLARKGNQLPELRTKRSDPVIDGAGASAPPAPRSNQPVPSEAVNIMRALATMQAEALKTSRFVGQNFAKDARAMHYGEQEAELIHGQASIAEAKELLEEGIGVIPLPFPVIPPDQAN